MKQNKVPLSCLPVSLFSGFYDRKTDLTAWSKQAAQIGLDYIDINIRCLLGMDPQEAAAVSETLPVPVMMVTTYSDFTNPEPAALTAAVEQAKQDIRTAAALQAKYLRLTAGQAYPGQVDPEVIERIYRCFEACIPAAEAAGIGLLIENHSRPGAWQYDDFDFHFERMVMLWERLQALPIGVNYDTANAFALHRWQELLDAFRGRIETVHVNDLVSVNPLKFACIGDGIVPLQEQLDAIFASGFRGAVCIEEAGMNGLDGIGRSVSYTRQLLEQVQKKYREACP